MANRIPDIYTRARLRNVTPVDSAAAEGAGEIGIGFDLKDGGTIRLAVPLQSAKNLAACLEEFIGAKGMP